MTTMCRIGLALLIFGTNIGYIGGCTISMEPSNTGKFFPAGQR